MSEDFRELDPGTHHVYFVNPCETPAEAVLKAAALLLRYPKAELTTFEVQYTDGSGWGVVVVLQHA